MHTVGSYVHITKRICGQAFHFAVVLEIIYCASVDLYMQPVAESATMDFSFFLLISTEQNTST